jgi:hypothetical protein
MPSQETCIRKTIARALEVDSDVCIINHCDHCINLVFRSNERHRERRREAKGKKDENPVLKPRIPNDLKGKYIVTPDGISGGLTKTGSATNRGKENVFPKGTLSLLTSLQA